MVSESLLASRKKHTQRTQNIIYGSNRNFMLHQAGLTEGQESKPYDSEFHFGLAKHPIFECSFGFHPRLPDHL